MNYKFLIFFSYRYAIPTGIPLQRVIEERGDTIWWFCDQPEEKKHIPENIPYFDTIQQVVSYEPHIVLTLTDLVPDFISGLKVQNFHGFDPEKRSVRKGHCRIRGLFDLYCTQGPATTTTFNKHKEKHPHFETIETGWSKVDPLFPIEKAPVTEKPTIFIASTFSKRLSLAYNKEVYEVIKKISLTGDYQLLLVLHPKIPEHIKQKWIALQNDSLTYHDTMDIIPIMKKANVMFSDTTSAIQEFGLLERPIVTFNHYVPKPHLINISDASLLKTTIDYALTRPKDILDNMVRYNKQLHPYTDGQSSERIINACINFLHMDKSHMAKKPLNLIRKYKIRKQLRYFTLTSNRHPFEVKKLMNAT